MLHPSSFCLGQQPPIQLRALSLGPHIGLHADDGARRDRPSYGLQILTALRAPRMPASITGWHRRGVGGPASLAGMLLRQILPALQIGASNVGAFPNGLLKVLLGSHFKRRGIPFGRSARVRSTGWHCHGCLRPAKANDYFYACDRPTHRRLDEACLTGNRLRLDRCPATPSSAFFP
jgi:hypothetical protein